MSVLWDEVPDIVACAGPAAGERGGMGRDATTGADLAQGLAGRAG